MAFTQVPHLDRVVISYIWWIGISNHSGGCPTVDRLSTIKGTRRPRKALGSIKINNCHLCFFGTTTFKCFIFEGRSIYWNLQNCKLWHTVCICIDQVFSLLRTILTFLSDWSPQQPLFLLYKPTKWVTLSSNHTKQINKPSEAIWENNIVSASNLLTDYNRLGDCDLPPTYYRPWHEHPIRPWLVFQQAWTIHLQPFTISQLTNRYA